MALPIGIAINKIIYPFHVIYFIISDTIPNQFQFPAAPSPAKSEQAAVDFWNSSAVMWW